jgi:hypothetical protein
MKPVARVAAVALTRVACHPAARLVVFASLAAILAACGKKGPPLAPLHLVPGPATALDVRRTGPEAHLQFVLPAANANGGGPSVLDRAQIYAVTLEPGMSAPPNRDLLTPRFLVGTMAVKPPPVEGEPAPDAAPPADTPPDTRPSAGDKVTFVEPLTPDKLKALPVLTAAGKAGATATETARRAAGTALLTTALGTVPARSAAALATAIAAAPATGPVAFAASFTAAASAALTAALPKYAVRVYVVQGMSKGGRAGQVSARAELPIVPVPAAPSAVLATTTETAIAITWVGPAEAPAATFNVYKRGEATPLNAAALAAPPFERPGVAWGTEECFTVRAVEKVGAASMESEPSQPACVTSRDTFPPAAPKGLSLVAGTGMINLSWDANGEADLAGYLVLRGEAPGDTLQPLTPAPIGATNFEDKTVKPGVRYAYAVVAIDKTTPPNRSALSAKVEETAR